MFLTQLRAILRASHYGKMRDPDPDADAACAELNQTLHADRRRPSSSLDDDGIAFDRSVPVGGMIEIPAAALALGCSLRRLDFLSIGTNDLIQYTLAIDRTDDTVAHLYDPLHPAVLRLVAQVIRTAGQGGQAGRACAARWRATSLLTRLLLGFGLRQFSMHPAHLLQVKQAVLKSSVRDIAPQVARMLKIDEPERMRALLARLNA